MLFQIILSFFPLKIPRMKRISDSKKWSIISLLQKGKTSRFIASRVGVSPATVIRVKRDSNLEIPAPTAGRKKIFTETEERNLVRKVRLGELKNAVETKQFAERTMNKTANPQTLRNTLKTGGLKILHKVQKPFLAPRNIKKRLQFCQQHRDWTIRDWEKVIWSDESKICRYNTTLKNWCWRDSSEKVVKYLHKT